MPKNERLFSSLAMISGHGRIANWPGGEPYWVKRAVRSHFGFFRLATGAIRPGRCHKWAIPAICPAFEKKNCTERLNPVLVATASPNRGRQFVVSHDVFLDPGRRAGWMDAASDRQAHRRGFFPAKFLDGDRQGPEDRLGAAATGALSGSSCGCVALDPDRCTEILVRRLHRLRHSHHGRSRQGTVHLDLRRQPGTSLVLVVDRRRSGAASPHRFRAFDLHGGELEHEPEKRDPFFRKRSYSSKLKPDCRAIIY